MLLLISGDINHFYCQGLIFVVFVKRGRYYDIVTALVGQCLPTRNSRSFLGYSYERQINTVEKTKNTLFDKTRGIGADVFTRKTECIIYYSYYSVSACAILFFRPRLFNDARDSEKGPKNILLLLSCIFYLQNPTRNRPIAETRIDEMYNGSA